MRGIDGYYLANRRVSAEDISEVFDQIMDSPQLKTRRAARLEDDYYKRKK